MIVSGWLKPAYAGVPRILFGNAVRLSSFGDVLASGNRSSTRSNAADGIPGPDNLPFASVRKQGCGFVVLICAQVSGDAWLEGCPHNTRWLVNTARLLSIGDLRSLEPRGRPVRRGKHQTPDATREGRMICHCDLYSTDDGPSTSVAWQPSANPMYAAERHVVVCDPDGKPLRKLAGLESLVSSVVVSPCARLIAATTVEGIVAVWSESGALLVKFAGVPPKQPGWHPERSLAFSPDSRCLAQAPCLGGNGFLIMELATGKSVTVAAPGTTQLLFHPKDAALVVSIESKEIRFRRLA